MLVSCQSNQRFTYLNCLRHARTLKIENLLYFYFDRILQNDLRPSNSIGVGGRQGMVGLYIDVKVVVLSYKS